jgi:hypothetical protein
MERGAADEQAPVVVLPDESVAEDRLESAGMTLVLAGNGIAAIETPDDVPEPANEIAASAAQHPSSGLRSGRLLGRRRRQPAAGDPEEGPEADPD